MTERWLEKFRDIGPGLRVHVFLIGDERVARDESRVGGGGGGGGGSATGGIGSVSGGLQRLFHATDAT